MAGSTTSRLPLIATHWSECWRVHLDCAIARSERLEAALLHQIGGCCFCRDCDATYALIDGGES